MMLTGHKTDAMFTRYTHLDEELGINAMKKLVRHMEGRRGERDNSEQKKASSYPLTPKKEHQQNEFKPSQWR